MPEFETGNKRARGRPVGAKNKRNLLPKELTQEAVKKLEGKVLDGDMVAIKFVLDRVYPSLKPVTQSDSLDGKLIEARLKEITEFDERLRALENAQ